jgi:uncharacterized protein YhaN
MRIQQLDLRAFGPFTDVTLDLRQGDRGVHIIVGPNEAGKSTTLRALRQMLFGFDHHISDDFVHKGKNLRIGGVLRDEAGNELPFLRRRGQKNTLRSLDDSSEIPESALAPFLGPLTGKIFDSQFGLDLDRLAISSKEMRESGGDLGQLLFGVGLDLGKFREYQKSLSTDADDLFTSTRASTKAIPKLIQEYQSACAELRDRSLPVAQWTETQEELARLKEERGRLDDLLMRADRERSHFGRIELAIPDVGRRIDLLAELDALKSAVVLRADFSEDRRSVDESHRNATRALECAREELAIISRELESLRISDEILGEETQIVDLHGRSGRYTKDSDDLIRLRGEARQMRSAIREILRDLGRPDDLDKAKSYRLKPIDKGSINQLILDYKTLQVELKEERKQLAKAEKEAAAAQESLDGLSETQETGPLAQAVSQALKLGDIEQTIQNERNRLKRTEAEWANDRSRLAVGLALSVQLESAPVVSTETIQRYAERLDGLESEAARLRDSLTALRKQANAHQRHMATLKKQGDIPTVADLLKARQARGEIWNRLKHDWSQPLIDEFETALDRADQLGDRLRNEAERVFESVQCTEAARSSEEDCETEQKALDDVNRRLEDANREWRQLWNGLLDGEPLSPREMESWRQHRDRLIAALPQIADLRDQLGEHERQADEARNALLEAAAALGSPITKCKTLASALGHSEELLNRFRELSKNRERLVERLRSANSNIQDARHSKNDVERRITDWSKLWGKSIALIGLDVETTIEQVSEVVKSLDKLSAAIDGLEEHEKRIRGIERDQSEYEAQARELLSAVAADLLNEPITEAVKQCWSRLDLTKSAKSHRDRLLQDRTKQEGSIRTALRDRATAEKLRKALCEEAGCDTPAELAGREEQSARRRAAETELSEIDRRLSRVAGGQALEEFVAEAAAHNLDDVRARCRALDAERETVEQRRAEIDRSQGAVKNQIDGMHQRSRDGKALDSSASAQHLLARITSHVDQYSRLRLASAILGQVVERYRKKHQAPLLSKAGAFFQELTGGEFAELRSDLDEQGKPRLIGLRGPQRVEVEIEGMSTGTVDQLYLALKLASLEHYLDHNPAMPFIVDDVLVQFDDDRALAALRAFATLSARTQVIFFTHHRHLAELARRELPKDVLFVHPLERRSAAAS